MNSRPIPSGAYGLSYRLPASRSYIVTAARAATFGAAFGAYAGASTLTIICGEWRVVA